MTRYGGVKMKEGFIRLDRWISKTYTDGKPRGVFVLGDDYCYGKVLTNSEYFPMKSIDDIILTRIEGNITLGLDIEFEVMDGDSIVYAGHRIDGGLEDAIGVDGSSCQVEFRPHYTYNARDLITNLEDLITDFFEKYEYNLSLRGDRYPLGAHIHIGYSYRSTEVNQAIAVIIDYLFGKLLKYSGDARGSYRRRLQWRRQAWGVEYRSLPTFIFRDKVLAEYILTVIHKAISMFLADGYLDLEYPTRFIKQVIGRDTYKDYLNRIRRLDTDFKTGKMHLLPDTWTLPLARVNDNYFRDDWNPDVKACFRRLLSGDDVLGYIFFGFKKERGLVSNIDIEGFEKITWDCPDNYIGLPWNFRSDMECYNKYCYEVLYAIRRHNKERRDKEVTDVSVSGNN